MNPETSIKLVVKTMLNAFAVERVPEVIDAMVSAGIDELALLAACEQLEADPSEPERLRTRALAAIEYIPCAD
jgi:hypothetical protein